MTKYNIGRFRGGFAVYWKDRKGKRRRYKLRAKTLPDAYPEAHEIFMQNASRDSTSLTVEELYREYIKHLEGRASEITMLRVWNVIGPKLGQYRIEDINPDVIRRFVDQRKQEHFNRTGKELSNGTIYSNLTWLRAILNYGRKIGLVEKIPYVPRPSKPGPKLRFLNEDELARFFAEAKKSEPHLYLACVLLYATGCRVGALLDLTWDRVDFERMEINLKAPSTIPRKGRPIVPMTEETSALLRRHQAFALSDFVIEYHGGPVKSIRKGFKSIAQRARIPNVSPHVMRHTAAVQMAVAGIPMHRISQFLGHSNTLITEMVYARFAPEHLRDEAKVLDYTKIPTVQDDDSSMHDSANARPKGKNQTPNQEV